MATALRRFEDYGCAVLVRRAVVATVGRAKPTDPGMEVNGGRAESVERQLVCGVYLGPHFAQS